MAGSDKTVFDPGATVAESGKPVLESDATVLDDGTTLLEAALSDAAGQMDADARENIAIQKGDTILDTYRVESDVIEGGMGSVWRVHHASWNIDLAMKRPQPKCFSTEKSKADFIHECEAWINLGLHPNIVSCYYVREIFGTPSIFSEWMDGGSLEKAIQKGTIYEGTESAQKERLLDMAIQFARGLHYAHEAGLIHQDVKPDNVLLTKEGEAKVADFGLARARAVLTVLEGERTMSEPSDGGKTMLSPSGGYTPAYCSMEQMDGKELTRRTDIYSWAVSAMEMYIGFRPWANGVVAGLSCAAYFKKARVPMPEALKTLLAQCLESEPEDRPHDFAEIESKLHEIYEAETGTAYPRPAPKAAADTADSLNNRALSFLDLGKTDVAEECWGRALSVEAEHLDSLFNQGLYLWRNGRIHDVAMLEQIGRAAQDGRRIALAAEIDRERGLDRSFYDAIFAVDLSGFEGKDAQITYSHDGGWIFVGSHENDRLIVLDAETGEVSATMDRGNAQTGCEIRAGTEEDVFWSAGVDALVRYSVSAQEPTDFFANDSDDMAIWSFALSKNDERAIGLLRHARATNHYEVPQVMMWDIRSDRRILNVKCMLGGRIYLSPDARRFAAVNMDNRIKGVEIWDTAEERATLTLGSVAQIISLSIDTNFSRALTIDAEGIVKLWELETGECLSTWPIGETTGREEIAFFPDLTRALITNCGMKHLLRVLDLSNGRVLVSIGNMDGESPQIGSACIHPRGTRLAAASNDGKLKIYPVPATGLKRAGWVISKIAQTHERLTRENMFFECISKAEQYLSLGKGKDACEQINRAREVEGFSTHPAYRAISRRAARICGVSGLRGVHKAKSMDGHWDSPRLVVVSQDGRFVVTSCIEGKDRQALLWDLTLDKWIWQIYNPEHCMAAAFHPDGKSLLLHCSYQVIRFEILPTRKPDGSNDSFYAKPQEAYPTGWYTEYLGFHPDGERFLVRDGACIRVWRLNAKEPIYARDIEGLNDLVLLPNGEQIALATQKAGILLLNFEDGRQVGVISQLRAEKLRISHKGRYLAANTGSEIEVYDLGAGRIIARLTMEVKGAEICFGQEDRFLWTQGKCDEICLWNVETGRRMWREQASLMNVCGLACGPDGDFLLSASTDHSLTRWELEWELDAPN